mmetsp:Transcript_65913/g.157292  ORF Transcript_65913/g.157292 Transcript_65913/m.157292 type:complete len:234 (+) Transcript_65913:68-769(+)
MENVRAAGVDAFRWSESEALKAISRRVAAQLLQNLLELLSLPFLALVNDHSEVVSKFVFLLPLLLHSVLGRLVGLLLAIVVLHTVRQISTHLLEAIANDLDVASRGFCQFLQLCPHLLQAFLLASHLLKLLPHPLPCQLLLPLDHFIRVRPRTHRLHSVCEHLERFSRADRYVPGRRSLSSLGSSGCSGRSVFGRRWRSGCLLLTLQPHGLLHFLHHVIRDRGHVCSSSPPTF